MSHKRIVRVAIHLNDREPKTFAALALRLKRFGEVFGYTLGIEEVDDRELEETEEE